MKLELKSIGYWSLIKVSFIVNFVLGLAIGLMYAVFFGFIMAITQSMGQFGNMPFPEEGIGVGVLVVVLPIFFGFLSAVFNTILVTIMAFVYNLIAKGIGGLELEFSQLPVQTTNVAYQNQAAAVQTAPPPQPQKPPVQPQQAPPQQPATPAPGSTTPPPPPPVQPYPGEDDNN